MFMSICLIRSVLRLVSSIRSSWLTPLFMCTSGTGDLGVQMPTGADANQTEPSHDPSGGSDDSFALAISHKSEDRIIIDAIREARPPFSPDAVVDDFAALLKSYRVSRVTGDRYAGEFPRELFREHGIACDLAKSEFFRDLLPLLNSGRIVLPRNDRLQGQIVGLERRTSAVGRDTISHPDRHDDVANAVAGAAALSKFGGYGHQPTLGVGRRRRQPRRLAARPSSSLRQQRVNRHWNGTPYQHPKGSL